MQGLEFVAFVLRHPTFKSIVAGNKLIGFADTELQVIVVAPCKKPPRPTPPTFRFYTVHYESGQIWLELHFVWCAEAYSHRMAKVLRGDTL